MTAFPLSPHSSGRYLIDSNGVPFFIAGDSAQTLINRLNITDIGTYFDARIAQGFNTFLIELSSHQVTASPCPANQNGDFPFTTNSTGGTYNGSIGTANFSTPKAAYWNFVDSVFNLAASKGVLLVVYVLAWGFSRDGSQGWWPDLVNSVNTPTVCTNFGTFLGNRYKVYNNIIWLEGSDDNGDPTVVTGGGSGISRAWNIMDGMNTAAGINLQMRSGDWKAPSESTNGPTDSTTGDSFPNYITLNGSYTVGGLWPSPVTSPGTLTTYLEARSGYTYVPVATTQSMTGVIPPAIVCFLKETCYEHSPFAPGTPPDLRKAQNWAIFSGDTTGLLYGDEHIWPFPGGGVWQAALTDVSALDMQRFIPFIKSYNWWKLYPSELNGMRLLVTSANGSQSGAPTNYIAAAQAYDGTFMILYAASTGSAQTFTVDTRSMLATSRARWFDPTNATYQNASPATVSNAQSAQSFTTPGTNSAGNTDWFLVLDVPTHSIPAPFFQQQLSM